MVFPLQRIEGKYEILRKLGEGGMGAVYMVRHRLLDEIRVIKVMRPQLESDEENRRRFIREAKVAIKLRHPNIAQLYDFTMDEDGTAFIVLEYIKGLTLDELLKKSGPPALPLALEIAIQSLSAIGYLHRRGFVHRDISPDNLMLSQDFEGHPLIKLIDLGIAKVLEGEGNLTATGMFLGKIRYSAPEQFEADVGSSHADARCDLYSFGMVLYELCTGRSPIAGDKPSAIIAGHLFRPPLAFEESDPEGRLPESLRETILAALEKKADDRPQTAEDFRKRLKAVRSTLVEEEDDLTGTTVMPSFSQDGDQLPGLKTPGTTQNVLDLQFGMGTQATIRTPVGAERPTRLESVKPTGRGPKDRITTLLAGAEKLAQLEQFQDAKLQLDIVLDIDPENDAARKLLGSVSETLDKVREQQTREALERISAEIETHLATGELVKAEAELHRAQVEFGEDAHLTGLGRRLEMLQDQARKARVAELVDEAEKLARDGQLLVAIDRLGTAELIDEGNSQVVTLLKDLEARLARSQELAKLAVSIAGVLEGGDLEKAEGLLEEAVAEYGEDPELEPLRERIGAARREQEQAIRRQAAAHFERGKKALDSGDPASALEALDAALALTADDMLALELKRQAEEILREQELAEEQERAEQARLDELLKQATAAAPAEALRLSEEVLRARRGDKEARAIAKSAKAELARLEAERQEAERKAAEQARLDELTQQAEKALSKRPEEALRIAQEALQSRPGDAKLEGIAERARSSIREAEEKRREEEDAAAEKKRLDALLADAKKASKAGKHERALELAGSLLAERPNDSAAKKIAESAESALQQRREEQEKAAQLAAAKKQRQARLEAAKKQILVHIDGGELDEAASAIEEASQELGDSAPFAALLKRLEKARKQEARRRIKGLVTETKKALEAGRSVVAAQTIRQALALDPAHAESKHLLSRAEGPLGLDSLPASRREAIEELARSIEEHLIERDLVDAEQALYVAKEAHGQAAWVMALGKRLEELESESRSKQIDAFLAQARTSFEKGNLSAARESVEKILLMDPDHRGARSLSSELDAQEASRKTEQDKEGAIVAAVNGIATLLDAGKAEKALEEVQKAIRDLGDHDALDRLRERAASALLERERLDDTAGPGMGATTILPPGAADTTPLPVQTPTVKPSPPEQKTRVLEREERPSQPAVKPSRSAAPKPRTEPKQSPVRPAGPRSPWAQPGRLLPLAAVVVALLLLVVWLANREPAAPLAGETVLILDALPWAQLESIEDGEGQAVDFGSERRTPLALDLPSGRYVLLMVGPEGGEPRRVEVELEDGATQKHLEDFGKIDANDYFREIGW